MRKRIALPLALAAVLFTVNLLWAMGFGLGQTKEELGLEYEVKAQDHGTGRVSVTLEIANEGRLAPISAVQLSIPSQDGTNHVDMSIPIALRERDGKKIAHIHLLKEWAERAELQIRTDHMDGKQELLTWYYHTISIAEHLAKTEANGRAPVQDPQPPAPDAPQSPAASAE